MYSNIPYLGTKLHFLINIKKRVVILPLKDRTGIQLHYKHM